MSLKVPLKISSQQNQYIIILSLRWQSCTNDIYETLGYLMSVETQTVSFNTLANNRIIEIAKCVMWTLEFHIVTSQMECQTDLVTCV